MKKVLYLCRGNADSNDFYFAPELPENYFSPGQFVIESKNTRGQMHDLYRFDAMQDNKELELELKPAERGRAYVVDAGANGKFYFKVVAMNRATRYAGKQQGPFDGMPFYRLEPANMQKLEQACLTNEFYFIGSAGG